MPLTSISRYQARSGAAAAIQVKIAVAVESAVTSWSDTALEFAQSIVAVQTGELRDSGHVVVNREGNAVTGAVVFDSDHAAFVEFGTGQRGAASPGAGRYPYRSDWPGMAAQPFLRPTFDEGSQAAQPLMDQSVKAALA